MNKQNTRLMYIESNKKLNDLSQKIELIDNVLDESKYFELLNLNVYIYGHAKDSKLLVGREIVGREEDFYHHDVVHIKDFNAITIEPVSYNFASFTELFDEIDKKDCAYRIELVLGKLGEFRVSFF